jgi:hypothetical protein
MVSGNSNSNRNSNSNSNNAIGMSNKQQAAIKDLRPGAYYERSMFHDGIATLRRASFLVFTRWETIGAHPPEYDLMDF